MDSQARPRGLRNWRDHRDLAELARKQYGVVSGRQMREILGYSQEAISGAARAGRLHRLHRDVYAVGHELLSRHGHALAAVLACGPGALLSHRSAAWLWGLLPSTPSREDVTGPVRRRSRGSIRLHHSQVLSEDDRAVIDGIPVTALPRTLLDLAGMLRPERLAKAIGEAERRGAFDLVPIEELLERVRGHRGRGRLRRVVAEHRHDPAVIRSEMERRFLQLVRASNLPQPSLNVFVAGHELDAYWDRERLAVELDSYEFHRTREDFERDHQVDEDLMVAGIGLYRVTWRRLRDDPQGVIRRVASSLSDRRAADRGRG